MSALLRRRQRDQRGVTIVEAAFVIPLLFLLIFGLIDVGLWVFQRSQASSAARDGARVGIVLNIATNSNKTANEAKINAAVRSRLAGQNVNSVTITCIHGGVEGDCDPVTTFDYGTDRLKVTVQWQRPFLTFVGGIFGASPTVSGTSTMVIVGAPSQDS